MSPGPRQSLRDDGSLRKSGSHSTKQKEPPGVFEKAHGSGLWWIIHHIYVTEGQAIPEKVGWRSDAVKLYQRRKTDARGGMKMPEVTHWSPLLHRRSLGASVSRPFAISSREVPADTHFYPFIAVLHPITAISIFTHFHPFNARREGSPVGFAAFTSPVALPPLFVACVFGHMRRRNSSHDSASSGAEASVKAARSLRAA
jgi:hypothetical protein